MDTNSLDIVWFQKVLDMLGLHFGTNVEVVLHDLSLEYEHTIIDIRNGHVTGRKIGDSGDALGLSVVRGMEKNGNQINYLNYTEDGKTLKSSTIFLRDEKNKPLLCFAINEDITEQIRYEKFLHSKNTTLSEKSSILVKDVYKLLETLIEEAREAIGTDFSSMGRADKIKFVEYLDKRGFFLITKSGPHICKLLKISKFTLYKYLEEIRNNSET